MPGDDLTVRLSGWRDLQRATRKANKNLRRNVDQGFREVAQDVATEARQIAASKGLRESGDLISGIRPFVLTGRAGVRSGATHRGFAYPRRLEFESRGAGRYGPRASLMPAVQAKQNDIKRGIEQALDGLGKDWTS